jgi:reverse gyrase
MEVHEHFTFPVPGYQFMPAFKAKKWDGKKRLLNLMNQSLPAGLLSNLKAFAKERKYNVKEYLLETPIPETEVTPPLIESFLKDLNVHAHGQKIDHHPHQKEAIYHCIKHKRVTVSSPTSSGKSLIIYSILRWFLNENQEDGIKVLLIVPTVSLVLQMYSDFEDYSSENSFNVEANCHKIYSGQEKDTEKSIIISTWQSMQTMKPSYFEQFNIVIADECLDGDTIIKTAAGHKKISDICIGEKIISYNINDNKFEEDEVVDVYKNLEMSKNDDMYEIEFENGNILKITGNHKILTKRGYVRADELNTNDEILDCINSI